MTSPPSALVLDLGGVLLTDGTKSAFSVIAAEAHIPTSTVSSEWHEQLRIPAELGQIDASAVYKALANVSGLGEERVRCILLDSFQPISEGVDVLAFASGNGIRTILATNHLVEWLHVWEERFAWWKSIDEIVCSAALGSRKPEVAFFRRVSSLVTDIKQTPFVDDDPVFVSEATRYGFHAILAEPGWHELLPPL